MGNWNITIRGVGSHHNKGVEHDANKMAAEFVQKLKSAGHNVVAASFTFGGEDDITNSEKYLEDRKKFEES